MKSLGRVITERIFFFFFFLIIVGVMNYLKVYVHNEYYAEVLKFVNANLVLMIMIHILIGMGEIAFWSPMPMTLLAPFLYAGGAMMIISLIFRVFDLFDYVVEMEVFSRLVPYQMLIYGIVVVITLIASFVSVLKKDMDEHGDDLYTLLKKFFDWLKSKLT